MDRLEEINKLVVHHTGGKLGRVDTPALIRFRHKWRNGWEDIGYHHVIGSGILTLDGELYTGRDLQYQGAHVLKGHNKDSIGVVMIGNFDKTHPTKKQMETLVNYLAKQCRLWKIPSKEIYGHRELDSKKNCPGKNVDMNEIRGLVGECLTLYQ